MQIASVQCNQINIEVICSKKYYGRVVQCPKEQGRPTFWCILSNTCNSQGKSPLLWCSLYCHDDTMSKKQQQQQHGSAMIKVNHGTYPQ